MAELVTKVKDIGGYTFEVSQLPYKPAQRLAVALLGVLGKPLLQLVQLAGGGAAGAALAALGDQDVERLVPLLSGAFDGLKPDVADRLSAEILATTRVRYNNKMVDLWSNIDAVLGGDFYVGLAIQAYALSVHFGNFSSARGAMSALGLKLKPSPSAGSDTSTAGKDGSSSGQDGAASPSSTG